MGPSRSPRVSVLRVKRHTFVIIPLHDKPPPNPWLKTRISHTAVCLWLGSTVLSSQLDLAGHEVGRLLVDVRWFGSG